MKTEPKVAHVNGLDAIRAVLALWVVVNHYAYGGLSFPRSDHPLIRTGLWLFEISFSGQAAVIIFFIISGFCIHWPYNAGKQLSAGEFLVNRGIRIGLPLCAALIVGLAAGLRPRSVLTDVLLCGVPVWSLWCEIIYYILYPLLNRLISKWGVKSLFGMSLVPAIGIFVATGQWNKPQFFHHGGACFWKTAVLGLPFWMLGAWLAVSTYEAASERINCDRGVIQSRLWLTRGVVWVVQALGVVLAYRFSVGIPLTLFLSLPLFVFWLRQEMRHFSLHPEPAILVWLGRMSFSIYLIHLSVFLVIQPLNVKSWSIAGSWLLTTMAVLFCSWGFYYLVERPSHRLAKSAAAWMRRRMSPPLGALESEPIAS